MNEAKYVLSSRHLYFFINEIVKHRETTVQQGILTGIIQGLNPAHYRDVLRAVVKAVYSSDDAQAAGRLSRAIVQGIDYIYDKRKKDKENEELKKDVDFIEVEMQKRGYDVQGLKLIKGERMDKNEP